MICLLILTKPDPFHCRTGYSIFWVNPKSRNYYLVAHSFQSTRFNKAKKEARYLKIKYHSFLMYTFVGQVYSPDGELEE